MDDIKISELEETDYLQGGCCFPLVQENETKKVSFQTLKNELPKTEVMVGTTTTGEAGTDASVFNSGTATAPILNFTIPKGDVGPQGEKGDKGDRGEGTGFYVGTTPPTDNSTKVWLDPSGNVDLPASEVLFTDNESLQTKFDNGDLGGGGGGGGTSGGDSTIVLENLTIIDGGYIEDYGVHFMQIEEEEDVAKLNEIFTKYQNGENLPRIVLKHTITNKFTVPYGGTSIELYNEEAEYSFELTPVTSVVNDELIEFNLVGTVNRISYGASFTFINCTLNLFLIDDSWMGLAKTTCSNSLYEGATVTTSWGESA